MGCLVTGHSWPLIQAHTSTQSPLPGRLHQLWSLEVVKWRLGLLLLTSPPHKITKQKAQNTIKSLHLCQCEEKDQTKKRHSAPNNCLNHFSSFAKEKKKKKIKYTIYLKPFNNNKSLQETFKILLCFIKAFWLLWRIRPTFFILLMILGMCISMYF